MKKSSNTASLVEGFADIGTTEVPEESASEIVSTIVTVFETYPDKYFTQGDFVKTLNRSNPRINKILNKLVADNKIHRIKTGNKFVYQNGTGQ